MFTFGAMTFKEFGFSSTVLEGLEAMGFDTPTPVQEKAIPEILKNQDLIAVAQTGTGKTAAFVLPVLDKIVKSNTEKVNTLILTPTRELAKQIDQQLEGFSYFTGTSNIAIYGGGDGSVFEKEKSALTQGAQIIIATPGRLLSHLNLKYFSLDSIEHFVLDEADRMLDMGFFDDLQKIAEYLPKKRQNILFSATMPPKIRKLAKEIMHQPKEVNIAISTTAKGVIQAAYSVYDSQKVQLIDHLLKDKYELKSIIIFTSRKSSVNEIKRSLQKLKMNVSGISSDLNQNEREEVLLNFRNKKTQILVATDVISRGIDIDDIDLVINFDVPNDAEDYVHRVGRTARANKEGIALTFINEKEQFDFFKIEELIKKTVSKIPLPDGFEEGPKYDPKPRKKFKRKGRFRKNGK